MLLVEDSIVRSTTMKVLLHEIRDRGGAREIHVRVACPPIIAPCFYGIDMSRKAELFAPPFVDPRRRRLGRRPGRMAKQLGADRLRYLPVEAIARSVDSRRRPTLPGLHHRPLSDRNRSDPLPARKRQPARSEWHKR